ncbi:hypothetical protein IQ07DRAFT_497578 [Pyrenochaeta sp. DS3sAY3a]|nr:hypothetical protein IQ07DRAFT_497578 [Pyrenochaeta sp. DS3sAY3a]
MCLLNFFPLTVSASFFHGGALPAHSRLHLYQRQSVTGFPLAEAGSLSGYSLSSACEQLLYQTIPCDSFVASFTTPTYHGNLGDADFTALVCSATCGKALSTMHRRLLGACVATPKLFSGFPVVSLVDSLWGGWNETCLQDTTSGKYCNDIIDSWPEVDDFGDLPKEKLCSSCLVNKYAAMRQNAYGVYDEENWKPRYDTIVKTCGLSGVTTTKTSSPISFNVTQPAVSCAGKKYIIRSGDTCDSIAQSNFVSAGSLYDTNPTLSDCTAPPSGLELCLPLSCQKIYKIKPGDDCVSVAQANGISWRELDDWNGMVDCYGVNMLGGNPTWGSTICISPPGGTFVSPPANRTDTGVGGPGAMGDGYGVELVDVPAGAELAPQTTTKCGQYYTVRTGDKCASIVVDYNVPSDLFIAANPSLRAARLCDARLVVGRTYCIHPLKYFDRNDPPSTWAPPTSTPTRASP